MKVTTFSLVLVVTSLVYTLLSIHHVESEKISTRQYQAVSVEFGKNVPLVIQDRILYWFSQVQADCLETPLLNFQIGNTSTSLSIITQQELQQLQDEEAFIVRSQNETYQRLIDMKKKIKTSLYCDKNDKGHTHHEEDTIVIAIGSLGSKGVSFGAYDALQKILGIGFFHPLKPTVPEFNKQKKSSMIDSLLQRLPIDITEKPHWKLRGIHIHTEHPLELIETLNGFGKNMTTDDDISWNQRLEEWEKVMEWLLANKQNVVQWVLLSSKVSWKDFSESKKRQDRLKQLVNISHKWNISVGMNVPIAMTQQHAWNLIRELGELDKEINQLHYRLDYLMECNFDYIHTQIGFTEFTHGNATRMLLWLNEMTRYLEQKWKSKGYSTIHVSQGQEIKGFIDPITHKDGMNYNFLPFYADKSLGILGHTVQIFGFDDPSFTYGNQNFMHIYKFMNISLPMRPVVWYPETCYWITFDINVPLFLGPVYADRRLHDIKMLRKIESDHQKKLEGQIIFSSGWEFTYWMNDVMAMRMSWDAKVSDPSVSHEEGMQLLLDEVWKNIIPNDSFRKQSWNQAFIKIAREQRSLLIDGKEILQKAGVKKNEEDLKKKTGISYIIGVDTWSELDSWIDFLTGRSIETQPPKISLLELRNGFFTDQYEKTIRPLLFCMQNTFFSHHQLLLSMKSDVPVYIHDLYDDLLDTSLLLHYRAALVYRLYQYAWGKHANTKPQEWLQEQREEAKRILTNATITMKNRIQNFRIDDPERIIGYTHNPTSYSYRYLWHASTLYFWWRDYGKIIFEEYSPCFMNVINPVDTVSGEGFGEEFVEFIRNFFEKYKDIHLLTDCLAAPKKEPPIPPFTP